MKPFFTVTKMNWGMLMPGSLSKTVYALSPDGEMTVQYIYSGSGPEAPARYRMKPEAFEELKLLLEDFPGLETRNDCRDGTGWEMVYTPPGGRNSYVIRGYIYEIEKLERIADLVSSGQFRTVPSEPAGSRFSSFLSRFRRKNP